MAEANTIPLCEIRGVTHEFKQPSGQPLRVLEDITLDIRPNEVVALLGPSGCGKSTILRILAGLIRPSHGDVLYHGASLAGLNPGAAIVFQSFALFPWKTVRENVELVLEAAGRARAEVKERAEHAIRIVGLAGFEDAFPRELSGGMKQRVGMARAFSLNPEILFMDEPFSQVDALTAESLRAEVLDIWADVEKNPSSILMVSHDIKEVAYMADRIVVLAANPGRVRTIVENKLPRPRDYRSRDLLALVDKLHDIITGAEMPDVAEPALPPGGVIVEPLPYSTYSEVTGLLEYLDARGGKEDIFRIAQETHREFGTVIQAVKAAELIDFVDTPKRQVVLVADGQRFVKATPEMRKSIWREQILKLGLFEKVRDALERAPDRRLPKEILIETIVMTMPDEDYDKLFDTLVGWARVAELFEYDEGTELLSIDDGSNREAA